MIKKLTILGLVLSFNIVGDSIFASEELTPEKDPSESKTTRSIVPEKHKFLNPPTLCDTSEMGYSQIVAPTTGKTVYLSGQASLNTKFEVVGETLSDQIVYTMNNLKLAIEAAGAKPENTVKINVLMVDHQPSDLYFLAAEMKKFFGAALPASTLIPVPSLAMKGMKFEIDATLVIPPNSQM